MIFYLYQLENRDRWSMTKIKDWHFFYLKHTQISISKEKEQNKHYLQIQGGRDPPKKIIHHPHPPPPPRLVDALADVLSNVYIGVWSFVLNN